MVEPTEKSTCFFCCKEDGNLLKITDEVLGYKLGELLASIGNLKVIPVTETTSQVAFCPACAEDVALAEEVISKVRQMLNVRSASAPRNPYADFTYECVEEKCLYSTMKALFMRRHHQRNHPDSPQQFIFRCPHCEESHKRPSALHKHIVSKHTVKVEPPSDASSLDKHQYQCTKCDYVTKSAKVFKKHHRLRHGDTELRIFPCPYCREVYQRVGALHSHIGVVHIKANEIKLEPVAVKTEKGGDTTATPSKCGDTTATRPQGDEANEASLLHVSQTSAIEFITDSDADESNMQCDGDVPVLMSEDIYTRLREVNEARKRKASLDSTDSTTPVKPAKRKEPKAKAARAAKLGGKAGKVGKKNAEAKKRSKDDGGIVKFFKFRDKNEKANGNDENSQLNGIEKEKDEDQSVWEENNRMEEQNDSHKDLGSTLNDVENSQKDLGNNQKDLRSNQKDLGSNQKDLRSNQKDLGSNQKDLGSNQKDLGNNQKDLGNIQNNTEENHQEDPEEDNEKGLKLSNKKSPKKDAHKKNRKSTDNLSPRKYTTRSNSKTEAAETQQMEELDAMCVRSPVKIPEIGKLYMFNEDTEEEPERVGVPPKRAEAVKFLKFPDADVNPVEDDKDVDATEDEGPDGMKSSPDDCEAERFLKFTLTPQETSSQLVKDNGVKFMKFADDKGGDGKEKEDEAKEVDDEVKEKDDDVNEQEDEAKEKEDDEIEQEDEAKEKEDEANEQEDEAKEKDDDENSKKDELKDSEREAKLKIINEIINGLDVTTNGSESIEEVVIKQEPLRDSDSEEFVAATQRPKKKRSAAFTRQPAVIKFAKFKDSPVNVNDSVPSSGLDTPERESKPTIACPQCPFVTQSRKRFARHTAQAHGSSGSSADTPTSAVPSKKRKRSVGDDQSAVAAKVSKRISCSGCEKSFKTTVKLQAHLVADHAMVEVHHQMDYQSREYNLY